MSANRSLQCLGILHRAARPLRRSRSWLVAARSQYPERQSPRHATTGPAQARHASSKARELIKPYTKEEKAKLKQKYTPEQLAAIEAGEEAIDVEDLYDQGALRHGPTSPNYIDDFSQIQPVVDKQPEAPEENYDPKLRFKTEDELALDLDKWIRSLPEDADQVEWEKFLDNNRLTVGKAEAELNPTNYLQPELPKLDDKHMRRMVREQNRADGKEVTPFLRRLSKQINLDVDTIRKLRTKALVERRVVNQTRMGKVASQYYMYVAGDGKGMLGIGEAKSQEPDEGRRQAQMNAIRNMVPIPRYEGRTIYGDVKGKVGATELELFTRPPGFGIRTQSRIYEMCKCAGISDIAARVTRARNPMNTVKATLQALLSQRDPEQIARARGRKMVDVRKVYYAGNV